MNKVKPNDSFENNLENFINELLSAENILFLRRDHYNTEKYTILYSVHNIHTHCTYTYKHTLQRDIIHSCSSTYYRAEKIKSYCFKYQ